MRVSSLFQSHCATARIAADERTRQKCKVPFARLLFGFGETRQLACVGQPQAFTGCSNFTMRPVAQCYEDAFARDSGYRLTTLLNSFLKRNLVTDDLRTLDPLAVVLLSFFSPSLSSPFLAMSNV